MSLRFPLKGNLIVFTMFVFSSLLLLLLLLLLLRFFSSAVSFYSQLLRDGLTDCSDTSTHDAPICGLALAMFG